MLVTSLIVALLAARVLPAVVPTRNAIARSPTPEVSISTDTGDPPCRKGKRCCTFKLRVYQRCIPKNNYKSRVQSWPLFYDFLSKDRKPITPIRGDYNHKACLRDDCEWASVGNITGPGDFYMRWQYQYNEVPNGKEGERQDDMTYWFEGVDHSQLRCASGNWTDYQG
ncbi:hypothetical protein K458DRAFT_146260 [Lentithecium fluviatile CBS 122367]|uniref:Uncharacterized protein n=1 Tax=Lentithecium fluviatile CBS 122367 TaxID=1168545 RepID=A0A6G1JCY9_9PLEO|nr:hypothetical protein K458DRAFT_146260 [Lentithecium fluviatile CBS 122367]